MLALAFHYRRSASCLALHHPWLSTTPPSRLCDLEPCDIDVIELAW
jgi:hypothetical protein